MRVLYLTYQMDRAQAGLFRATHERIVAGENYFESSVRLNLTSYDTKVLSFFKRLINRKSYFALRHEFYIGQVAYKNIYIKNSLFTKLQAYVSNRFRSKETFESKRYVKLVEDFLANGNTSFDMVMAHWILPTGLVAKAISGSHLVPYFLTAHGSDLNKYYAFGRTNRSKIETVIGSASGVLYVSRALFELGLKINPNVPGMVSENGVSVPHIESTQIQPRTKKASLLFVGNLEKVKGADRLPDIVALLSDSIEFSLKVVGDGSLREKLEKKLPKLNSDVYFYGQVEHEKVIEIMHSSDLLLMPSRNEGMPLVLLEALSVGVVPVASEVGGIPEVLARSHTVCDDENFIKEFSNRIVSLLEDDSPMVRPSSLKSWPQVVEEEFSFLKALVK